MLNKKFGLLLIFMIICFIPGCLSSQAGSGYKQFKDSYISATGFIEKDNDYLVALKKMDTDKVDAELKKMKVYMDKMDIKSKSTDEEGIYGNAETWYRRVEFLLYAAKKKGELTDDEKDKVYTECSLAELDRDNIKDGEF